MLVVGNIAPDFTLMNQDNIEVTLNDYRGQWVVLYFYPKDNTGGCTKEAIDFTEHLDEYKKLNAQVFGISPDLVSSHQSFIKKHDLKVDLLADPDHKVLGKYGVWREKSMHGRKYFGVVRSTYLINPGGKIEKIWEKVSVDGHANDVMCEIQDYQK
ncbi:thioredoxin-dependent thiol peroxidase [bacterium]|nr:thioredoxin-dependent thiol peroxidase [bacterium]MBU1065024.1 thioredoxin-dependent thiol peroxidase [bacterium]MBU1635207.1 thioredoxin-dependent thiol peroxidase [bacterium]MBU1874385.1 thioredoxin-dependent thiol peroxidase [bacterium]